MMNSNNNEEKEKIEYEKLIAGAMLNFDTIDNVDFSLLVEDFEMETNTLCSGCWYHSDNNLGTYITTLKNGTIKLRENITLDTFIENENTTLREKLERVAGNIVNNYFKNFDIEKFKKDKADKLSNNKKNVLDKANVLLISDINSDYDELIKYGFKNVDWFKSIIRADQYFNKHPKDLEKYHIVLKGNQSVQDCCFLGGVPLDEKIQELRHENVLKTSLNNYGMDEDNNCFITFLGDDYNNRDWDTEEKTYTDVFDRIVENTLINHTLEKVKTNNEKFIPIKDYENPNRLPLPRKKEDLKILYLDAIEVNKYAKDIANKLGLNITFKPDNNFSLGKNVKNHLGDYDIIIASDTYSRNIIGMNNESTEQCKDTGRDLTLLAINDFNPISMFDEDNEIDYQGIGLEVKLHYKYGGKLAIDSVLHNKNFKVLRENYDFITENDDRKKYYENEISSIIATLSSAVNLYNEALLKNNKAPIEDIDMKSAEEFHEEYDTVDKELSERKEKALAPIKTFDMIRSRVVNYLNYRKEGLLYEVPEGLNIKENSNTIKVEYIYQGRPLCAIIFPKAFDLNKNLRILQIQTISKKGNLMPPETIGLYTKKYENTENIPNRPNEIQAKALLSLDKKINAVLKPLNEKGWNNYLERKNKKEQQLVLKRKQKKTK